MKERKTKVFCLKKRDIKYILTLLVLAVFTIVGFVEGIKDVREYDKHNQNAVTVIATVESSHLQFREEVKWNAGAGDIVDKEVTKVPYYTYSLSYTFEGKEYKCGYGGYFHTVEMLKGTQVELVIDSSNPEYIITENQNGKADFFFGWLFLLIFLAVLLTWLIRRFKVHK